MRALLDTQVFLWWNLDVPKLSRRAFDLIGHEANDVYVSVASAWEIGIKYAKGRLMLEDAEPGDWVPSRIALDSLQTLSIELSHALRAGALPPIHRDPFDRLLIAQAQIEGLPILTSDPNIARYDVEVIW